MGKVVNEMTAAVEQAEVFLAEAAEKLEALDVEGINQAFSEVDEFVNSMDGVVEKANDMVDTIDDVNAKLDAVAKQFEPIIETLNKFKNIF